MKRLIATVFFTLCLSLVAFGQQAAPTPIPTPTPITKPALQPIPLSNEQMQQLVIVNTQEQAALETVAKLQAQRRALIREFAWALGVNPADFEAELSQLDERGTRFGFVPKSKPQESPQPAQPEAPLARPEPTQTGKQH